MFGLIPIPLKKRPCEQTSAAIFHSRHALILGGGNPGFFADVGFALPPGCGRGKMIGVCSLAIHLHEDRETYLKISVQLTVIIAAIFAIICFSVAFTGFNALGSIADPAQAADAKGFASFWAFLGAIAVIFGALGVWMVRTHKESDDD